MKFPRQFIATLVVLSILSSLANAQFSNSTPEVAQQTQAQGYWVDNSTGQTWTPKDNDKRLSWHGAVRYCRDLRLAGHSDWRLPSIQELERLVNVRAYATEHVGSSDILHRNSGLQMNGGISLTAGRQWSSSPEIDVDGSTSKASFWYFDFGEGVRRKGFEDVFEGDHMGALCVRDPDTPQAGAKTISGQSPSKEHEAAHQAESMGDWTDPSTGLTWMAKDNGKDVNLRDALMYCRNVRDAKPRDWRLATISELEDVRRPDETTARASGIPLQYRLPIEFSFTGDEWSGSPVSNDTGYSPGTEWYFSLGSKNRLADEPSYSHAKRAICVRESAQNATDFGAHLMPRKQTNPQKTQELGYWDDPATGLMWAGKDDMAEFLLYIEANRYCHELRLAHYSDWRLPTVDELRGIYDRESESPGASLRRMRDEPETRWFHVKGNLFLTGMTWGAPDHPELGKPDEGAAIVDFTSGQVSPPGHDPMGRRALCVRKALD